VILFVEFFFNMYFEVKIMVVWNNHESGVLMNDRIKNVENYGINSECMHVKCKFIVTIVWNNFVKIKSHFYHTQMIIQLVVNI
jgi:hypothetical protein